MKICENCAMPIISDELYSTNKDGSINYDYCKYCYKDGEFTFKVDMDTYIKKCSKYSSQANMSEDEMTKYLYKVLPTLKRWR